MVTGATRLGDPQHYPWTMGLLRKLPEAEGRIYASYILAHHPGARIGVLYQNDDFGKDYLNGLTDGLGAKVGSMIVMAAAYETTDPTVDSQIVRLKSAGADLFFNIAIPKFAAQAIRKTAEIGWEPVQLLCGVVATIAQTLKPAGLENCKGMLTSIWGKDVTDPIWQNDAGYREWLGFMNKWYPQGDKTDATTPPPTPHRRHGAGAEAMRRRSDPRERDAAGRQPEPSRSADATAGDHNQHEPDRFPPDQAGADGAVRRRHWVLFGPVLTA